MIIKEFRVALPFSLEEYRLGQLWSVAQASKNETGGGEGVEVLVNEEKDHTEFGRGQYTHKIYHLAHKVPRLVRVFAPQGLLEVHEVAWNCFPFVQTTITNPGYMRDGFHITITTIHKGDDRGKLENVHKLKPEQLAMREVVDIDIVNDEMDPRDYKAQWDPSKVHSTKTGRGPLKPDWKDTSEPIMCAYKLVECEFRWFGLQTRVENRIMHAERRVFTNFHRQVFCWLDQWHGLTLRDIRRIEAHTKIELDKKRASGEVTGMSER